MLAIFACLVNRDHFDELVLRELLQHGKVSVLTDIFHRFHFPIDALINTAPDTDKNYRYRAKYYHIMLSAIPDIDGIPGI